MMTGRFAYGRTNRTIVGRRLWHKAIDPATVGNAVVEGCPDNEVS